MADVPNTAVLKQLSRVNDKLDLGNNKLDKLIKGQEQLVGGQQRVIELLEAQVELMKPLGTKSPGWSGGQIEEETELA